MPNFLSLFYQQLIPKAVVLRVRKGNPHQQNSTKLITSSRQMIPHGAGRIDDYPKRVETAIWNSRCKRLLVILLQEDTTCILGRGMLRNEVRLFVEVRRRF
jgi:hypothetical protein